MRSSCSLDVHTAYDNYNTEVKSEVIVAKRKLDKTPATSEGARYERQAFRNMLRRRAKAQTTSPSESTAYEVALDWVLKRQQRYEKKPGGL